MDIKSLLKWRAVWMAIAILWIMLFHAGFNFSFPWVNTLKSAGYGGVDIFMFASGLGCYFSYGKDKDFGRFIKKRAIKILPIYWFVLIFWFIIKYFNGGTSVTDIIGNIFCVQDFPL